MSNSELNFSEEFCTVSSKPEKAGTIHRLQEPTNLRQKTI
jgi:hypothetical protein